MKQPTAPPAKNEDTSGGNTTATNEPTREQLEEEFRLDDAGEYEIELLTLRLWYYGFSAKIGTAESIGKLIIYILFNSNAF